ncbi:MAG: hypothetical protein LBT70_04780 [Holosporaceae bacterium]|nr:hypothetical protein [Holosporaceae bacterium]
MDLEQQKQKQQQKIADLDNLELILEQVESQLRKQWQGSLPPVQKAPYRFLFEGEVEEEELNQAVLNAVTVEQLLVNSGINYSPNKFRSEYSLGLKPNDVGVPFVNPADLMKSFSESASLLESVEGQKLHFSLGYPDSIHMKALKILAEEYNKGTENHKEFLAFLLLFKTRDTWHMAGNILSIYFYPKYALILSSDLIFSLDLIFSSDLLLSSDLILSSDFFLSLQKRIGRLGKIDGIFSILGSLKDEEAVGKVKSIILAEHSTRITTENFDEVRVKFDQLNLLAYAEKIREKIERLKQELVAIAIGK